MVFTTTLFKLKSRNNTVCYIKSLDVLGLLKRNLTDSWTSVYRYHLPEGNLFFNYICEILLTRGSFRIRIWRQKILEPTWRKRRVTGYKKKIMWRSATVCLKGDYHNSRIKNYSLLVVNQNWKQENKCWKKLSGP